MTRLPPYTEEPARTEAVMAEVRRTIHMHLHNTRRRKRVDGDVDLLTAAESIENRWAELNPQSADRPSVSAPDEAVAASPKPTTASLFTAPEKRNFSGNFLLPVKQEAPFSASFTHANKIIRRDDAAKLLGVSLRWFDHNIKRLLDDFKFPSPRDAKGQRRWRFGDVVFWRETYADANAVLKRARAAHRKTLEKRT